MWKSVGVCIVLLLVTVAAAQVTDRCGDPVVQANAKLYAVRHPNRNTSTVYQGKSEYRGHFECKTECTSRENAALHKKRSPLNSVSDPNKIWPNGTMYYTIQKDTYTTEEISTIKDALAQLVNVTKVNGINCVQIVPRTTETAYINVLKLNACSSFVGRNGNAQNLSLVVSCLTTPGAIMHEFLHAFGFFHEQSRKDRDNYVWINYCNINPELDRNFATANDDPLGTPYDYKSIMHYGAYDFAVDTTLPTIIPKDLTVELIQRPTLSPIDIERVQILYKCLAPADSRFFKHLDRK